MEILRRNSVICHDEVEKCNAVFAKAWQDRHGSALTKPLLSISKPCGAMYAMIGINMAALDDQLKSDTGENAIL